jgi:parvulin-like peptidyl-prolyl isomerase
MKKLIAILFCCNFVFGAITDGVAIIVNNEPITLFEISKNSSTSSKAQAADALINDLLFKQELKKNNISVDMLEVQERIELIAKNQNLTALSLKEKIKSQNQNYEDFVSQIKDQMVREKFIQKIVRQNIKVANDEDLKLYYENNQAKFQNAKSFDVTQYSSANKQNLSSAVSSVLSKVENVEKTNFSLQSSELNPQLLALLNETTEGTFTPIFNAGDKFVSFLVTKKLNITTTEFEKSKDKIFEIIMKQREDAFLKEYFNKIRLNAKIQIIR